MISRAINSNGELTRDTCQLSEFLWAIANVSFDEARTSICLCYNAVYVRSQMSYTVFTCMPPPRTNSTNVNAAIWLLEWLLFSFHANNKVCVVYISYSHCE